MLYICINQLFNYMKYDFIEIGTSDFDTLIEQADDNTVGLSIEPLKYYLDRLPDRKNVKKLNVAISNKDSYLDLYYIPEKEITKHNLPWWVRGSNSIGKPHAFTIKEIGKELYDQIVQVLQVKCISMKSLILDNDVEAVDHLKIDTEGMDHIILEEFLDICSEKRELLPKKITFERSKNVSNMYGIGVVMSKLKEFGYFLQVGESDVVAFFPLIPKIIHQTYKSQELPLELMQCVARLTDMNPEFEYRFYDDIACEQFIRDNYDPGVLEDYLRIDGTYGAARADLFRYLLMYKIGGVYLDIKSGTTTPLSKTILPTDEYLLTHWAGRDWADELGYVHGEFQNWHIICVPGHPFLKVVIDLVRNNIKSYKGETGKEAVLRLTGPIAYSKAILTILDQHRKMTFDSPVREFRLEEEIGLQYMMTSSHHHTLYSNSYSETKPIVKAITEPSPTKVEKAYVLYANDPYIPTLQACVKSINLFSDIPVFVYLINSDKQIEGATTINWKCDVPEVTNQKDYIDRKDSAIYKMMIERPNIVKHALTNYTNIVCYVDADSVATQYVDNIFSYFSENCEHPMFVEGIYDYFHIDGRGGADTREDMSTTLEAPACELFGVDQYVRQKYRQTGYFVAGQGCYNFLAEWYSMCKDPTVMENHTWYAPYHEETLANVLLWKYNIMEGLPYIYCNADRVQLAHILANEYEWGTHVGQWLRLPSNEAELLFIHGEKKPENMSQMTEMLLPSITSLPHLPVRDGGLRIMFLAPHLSTGGMPAFLQKRIEALQQYTDVEIFVVEYQCYSLDFIVQRTAIINLLLSKERFTTLYEDKMELFRYIDQFQPDVIHIDEMSERMDQAMIARLYDNNRKYRIIETCHDVSFAPAEKKLYPNAYAFCTPYHLTTFADHPVLKNVIEFPIENSAPKLATKIKCQKLLGMNSTITHVLNVGLWTPGKNQGEGLEIARRYPHMHFHFVGNQAGNFADYWKPLMNNVPKNVTIWGERDDIPMFYKACDIFMFNSTWECNPLVLREAIGYGLPIIGRNLPQYGDMFTEYLQSMDTDLNTIERGYKIPGDNRTSDFAAAHEKMYKLVMNIPITPQSPLKVSIIQHFVDQPFVEIKGQGSDLYTIKMFDENILVYENTITPNHWIRLNRKWFTKWRTEIWNEGKLIYENTLSLKDKRVYIALESSALGDTLAWVPYALEFQEKHQCHVILSTFKNDLFAKAYPELEFVNPGVTVNNLYAMYKVGTFYDQDREPEFPNSVPLQKVACNILGLEYREILPRLVFTPRKRMYKFKYVTIATNSTSGCKYWQKADWQLLVDYLISKGYKVINVSKEKNPLNGVDQIQDSSMENTMHTMYHAEFMVGLSSGLSWLNWALGKKTVLIANFTSKSYEFKRNCIRITDKSVCHDCWKTNKLDPADWNWCPYHKGTPRQFECQRAITAAAVIERMQPFITGTDFPGTSSETLEVTLSREDFQWGWMDTPEGLANKRVIQMEMEQHSYERYFEVEEGDNVLDIGASVGTFTWSILKRKPSHVWCIEPSLAEFPTLKQNVESSNVTCINKGIWHFNGGMDNPEVFGENKTMWAMTFNAFMEEINGQQIDFMKCDCEGGEYAIFTGMNTTFWLVPKVKKMAVEFHLGTPELKREFRIFRDTILPLFPKYHVCSIDGMEITEHVHSEEFIQHYREIMIYIDNR